MQVECGEDCGNAPKKALLRDFTIALATRDVRALEAALAPDASWTLVDGKRVSGPSLAADLPRRLEREGATRLVIHHILTHGAIGAVDGTLEFKDGRERGFCDVYEFKSAKGAAILRARSYASAPP